jgi:biopolymer transport protein ExbD
MVLLMVFTFALAPTNICDRRIRADIPVARHSVPLPNAVKEDAIYIYILRDQELYFGNSRPMIEELGPDIRKRIMNGSEMRIYLEVDSRVSYGLVRQVLEQIQDAKVQNVTFIVKSNPT